VLSRRPVTPTSITYTGPVRKVDEAMAQLITDPDDYRMVKANTQLAPVLIENDDLRWPHRDGLIWPHFSSVVVGLDVA